MYSSHSLFSSDVRIAGSIPRRQGRDHILLGYANPTMGACFKKHFLLFSILRDPPQKKKLDAQVGGKFLIFDKKLQRSKDSSEMSFISLKNIEVSIKKKEIFERKEYCQYLVYYRQSLIAAFFFFLFLLCYSWCSINAQEMNQDAYEQLSALQMQCFYE